MSIVTTASRPALRRAALIAATLAGIAGAHAMPRGQGAVRVLDSTVCADLVLPSSAAAAQGRAPDSSAILRDRAPILTRLQERFAILDRGTPGRILFQAVSPEGAAHLRLTRCLAWSAPVTALSIRADVFEGAPATDRQLTLHLSRGTRVEAVVFDPERTVRRPFRGPWLLLADFVGTGFLHILTGFDHLLFLLTILVAGAGWRRWLAVVTSFTVAHSITLALSVLGRLRLPPEVVEPLIAASIVVVALDNFRRSGREPRHQVAVVFACGLLHGMGFASAIADLGVRGASLWASLAGFNLGVEAGQATFLLGLLGLSRAARRLPWWTLSPTGLVRGVSAFAAAVGALLVVQRIFR